MPVKCKIPFQDGIYFITFTCYNWFPLIEMIKGYDLIYKWFDHLKSEGHFIVGYQIMPNHVHSVIAFRNTGIDINTIVGNGKRIIGYQIVKRLQKQGFKDLMTQMAKAVNASDRRRGKLHEVWEDSFDWKECIGWDRIMQKLDYMHCNVCRGKWNLAESPSDYVHSSAKFYTTGEQGIYHVTHFMELEDVDLTKKVGTQ